MSDITIPCLSIRPPWAQAIVSGVKDVENRTWETSYRGPVLIHASQKPTHDGAEFIEFIRAMQPPLRGSDALIKSLRERPLVCGAIIGMADLTGIVRDSPSIWAGEDQFHWLFSNAKEFAVPIRCNGKLRLWKANIPQAVLDAAKASKQ